MLLLQVFKTAYLYRDLFTAGDNERSLDFLDFLDEVLQAKQ